MHSNIIGETSLTLGNENAFKKSSLSSELIKVKKKHINLNNLIHILSHRAQYNIEHIKKKSYSLNINTNQNIETEPSRLFTKNKLLTKNHTIRNIKQQQYSKDLREVSSDKQLNNYDHSNDSKVFPLMNSLFVRAQKREKENTHLKLLTLNEREQQKKAFHAHKLKEKNKVLKENIILMKSKTLTENIQKKLLVETQKKLQRNSIENYKIIKNIQIKSIISNELRDEIKVCNKKEKEALFWKTEYNKRKSESIKD